MVQTLHVAAINQNRLLMTPTQENSREFLQQAIDAEIKALEKSLQVLRLRRNVLQPISSLPPEMLATIFSFLCLPGIPSLGGEPDRNRTRFRITRVCHQWRDIALNQPQLWSHINFNTLSLAGATEILVRAKSVPLYMEIRMSGRVYDDPFRPFLKEVQARLPLIRHLSIGAEATNIRRGIKHDLVLSAPNLQYLSIICQERDRRILAKRPSISDTLFGGSTPRLSCLVLRNCNISWNFPLFKSLTSLEIILPCQNARPELAVWLDALDGIPQLKTLTLHSASPIAFHFPFNVERTITLPSLTRLDIRASLGDCALAIAHLVLPALTSLCVAVLNRLPNINDAREILPYVLQHVHGPQDIQPLQSVLIRNRDSHLELLAWPVPDIDSLVHDETAILGATLPPRVKLYFRSKGDPRLRVEIFKMAMAALPLDDLVMLTAVELDLFDRYYNVRCPSRELIMQEFWLGFLPCWPLLRRVRLAPGASRGFIKALLEDNSSAGWENPLLPSLTELALVDTKLDTEWALFLCDALMKRVEQRVPLEKLDLRICGRVPFHFYDPVEAVRLLSEIVVDILPPLETPLDFFRPQDTEATECNMFSKIKTMWYPLRPCSYSDDDSSEDENETEVDDDDD
jgi:hypothetical protein